MSFIESARKAEALKKELEALPTMSRENEDRLWKKFRLEWNYNSNHIEGNTLTYGETELYLIFDKTTGDHSGREYEEMKAHDVAVQLIKEWAQDKERDLTEADIRTLNEIILVRPYWKEAQTYDGQPMRRLIKIGEYKDHPNSVRLPNGEMFHYASPEETPQKMATLMEEYRNDEKLYKLHPFQLAAEFHHKFVLIHPFDDGNGRVARLLMNYILMKGGYPPVIIKSADKTNYLTALQKADSGDKEAFMKYITDLLVWSLELAIKAAKGEDLEETDDIDKEIALWKRSLDNKGPKVQGKTDDQIAELYIKSLSPFFSEFRNKIISNFGDLFAKIKELGIINNSEQSTKGQQFIDEEVNALINKSLIIESASKYYQAPKPKVRQDISQMGLKLELRAFNKAGVNLFDIYPYLTIDFQEFTYIIRYNGSNKAIKLYSEFLNAAEQVIILKDIVKTVFEEIQQNTKNQ